MMAAIVIPTMAALLATLAMTAALSAEVVKITHQGIERGALLHRPASAPAGPQPLVIALHGFGGTGEAFRAWAGFDAVGDREGFTSVYPDAIEKRWSYGRPIVQPMPTVAGQTVDDVGFIQALIDDLVARNVADPARIYVAGISRGGLMAFTLACELSDRIAAAASVVTGMTDHQREDCRPSRPIPIMMIAGTNDYTQAYDGWLSSFGRLLSVPETMEFWRSLHGCSAQRGDHMPRLTADERTQVALIKWSNCRSGAILRLYRVEGGGHQMPSIAIPTSPMSEDRFGLRNRDIESVDEMWKFFQNATR